MSIRERVEINECGFLITVSLEINLKMFKLHGEPVPLENSKSNEKLTKKSQFILM